MDHKCGGLEGDQKNRMMARRDSLRTYAFKELHPQVNVAPRKRRRRHSRDHHTATQSKARDPVAEFRATSDPADAEFSSNHPLRGSIFGHQDLGVSSEDSFLLEMRGSLFYEEWSQQDQFSEGSLLTMALEPEGSNSTTDRGVPGNAYG